MRENEFEEVDIIIDAIVRQFPEFRAESQYAQEIASFTEAHS